MLYLKELSIPEGYRFLSAHPYYTVPLCNMNKFMLEPKY